MILSQPKHLGSIYLLRHSMLWLLWAK
jgi:hypothetical protein